MKRNALKVFVLALAFIFTLAFLPFSGPVLAAPDAANPKILILPFKIHAEKDLSFLNHGIMAMLASRLSSSGRAAVLQDPAAGQAFLDAPAGQEAAVARDWAARLGAKYVLVGSVTLFGNSVSTDAQLVDVTGNRPAVTFSQFGQNAGDVIPHIHALAGQINADVFDFGAAPKPAPALPAALAKPAAEKAKAEEKEEKPAAREKREDWKSARFKSEVRSMAAADVTGDGRSEVVLADRHDVTVKRYVKGQLETIGEYKGKDYETLLGVDAADIDKNGRAKIFVTRLNKQGRLSSFVLEWSDGALRTAADGLNWYFRVIRMPEKGDVLLGQRRGLIGPGGAFDIEGADRLFMAGVFELQWRGRELVAGKRQDIPRKGNIYGVTFANVTGDKKQSVVAITDDERLRIMDRSGKKLWTGSARYPGSGAFMEYRTTADQAQKNRYYLPPRILAADLDGDGAQELLVVKNKDIARGLLSRFRSFDAGQVECLAWDHVTMKTKWETDAVSGYVSDAALADIDGDGRLDLVSAVVQAEGSVLDFDFSKATSYLVTRWDIE